MTARTHTMTSICARRLARISLAFGRVNRATFHEDGARPETDTDHTVMLGLVACELAPPELDRAKVAAFALVHDLVEVYAGDTQTLTITSDGMAAKRAREDAARARLVAELGEGSWIAETLTTYEEQRAPEARFVRLVDKVLPKLTHAFNGCVAAKLLTDRAGFVEAHARQLHQLREQYPEFPDALELLRASMIHAEARWSPSETPTARTRLDAGDFFDRPPPRRWIAPAFLAALFFAGAAYNVFTTGDAFARGFSCACGIFWGVEMLGKAWARRGAR